MPLTFLDVVTRLAQFAVMSSLFGAAAASAFDGKAKGWVFAGVTLIAFGAMIGIWRTWRSMVAFPSDEFGPLTGDKERYEEHLAKVERKGGPKGCNLVKRWKVQGRMRTAFEKAREAGDLERVEAYLERAREQLEAWRSEHSAPRGEKEALERRFREEWDALRTLRYVNAAQSQLDHAASLKTERGRTKARERAREILDRGLADSGADDELLRRFGKESGLLGVTATAKPKDLVHEPPRWVPLDVEASVQGSELRGPAWIGRDDDPSVIDTHLKVGSRASGSGWEGTPDYADLQAPQRAFYLRWLARGRLPQDAPPGCGRLLLFTIERRLFTAEDSSTEVRAEAAGLVRELERLAAGFEERDRRLATTARSLARYAALRFPFEVSVEDGPGPLGEPDSHFPPRIWLGLAGRVSAGKPLPVAWARAWLHHALDGELRTPAQRAPEDFERLFALRYAERYGEGLVVTPGAAALRAVVRPLSPAFAGEAFQSSLDLPDPRACPGVASELDALADSCCEELAGLSRALGRSDGRAPDLKALATLPRELLAWHDERPLEALRHLLAPGPVQAKELAALWPKKGRLAKSDCARYAGLLAKLGFGVEPDPRFGGPPWPEAGEVELFALASDAPSSPSRAYEAAALIVHVAITLAAADREQGDVLVDAEEEALREHLQTSLDLPAAERRRLEVHLTWLRRHPPGFAGLKRRVGRLDDEGRGRLADFLLRIACADGRVTPAEVRMLERAYELLGRDPGSVHGDLHRRTSGAGKREDGLALDPARLAQKLAETRQVSALLGDVFQEDEPAAPTPPETDEAGVCGLDSGHSALLRRLATQADWPRAELEEMADELGLLLDGALDALNDTAFEQADAPLWEGDDPLWVDVEVGAQLLA